MKIFEVYRNELTREWHWRLLAHNVPVAMCVKGHRTRSSCAHEMEMVRQSQDAKVEFKHPEGNSSQ